MNSELNDQIARGMVDLAGLKLPAVLRDQAKREELLQQISQDYVPVEEPQAMCDSEQAAESGDRREKDYAMLGHLWRTMNEDERETLLALVSEAGGDPKDMKEELESRQPEPA